MLVEAKTNVVKLSNSEKMSTLLYFILFTNKETKNSSEMKSKHLKTQKIVKTKKKLRKNKTFEKQPSAGHKNGLAEQYFGLMYGKIE